MGLRVTAEGVENQDSHDILKKLGCDDLQGYFISKPLHIDEFDEWFKTYNENANWTSHTLLDTF